MAPAEYWHVSIEPTLSMKKRGGSVATALDRDRDWIEQRILQPRRRGEPVALDGRTFKWEDVERIRIGVSTEPSSAIIARLQADAARTRSRALVMAAPNYQQRAAYAARDVTDELIDGPPGSLAEGAEGEEALSHADPRAVMVVYGRNLAARDAVFDYLRALGLKPLEWSQLVTGTGSSAPYVGEVLEHAFQRARAVVVILTPDDEARLREQFRAEDEATYEIVLTPQARSNVLFEAGMAFGVHPDRTLLVQVGSVRPFSDVAGRHVVRIDGSEAPLRDIARRLATAGCDVDTSGDDWASGSRFARPLELVAAATTGETSGTGPDPISSEEMEAIHDLLDELESMRLRIERARRDNGYAYNFDLPSAEYHEHKADLSGELRESVGRVYVTADDLTREVAARESRESAAVQPEDNLDSLSGLISFAQMALRERRTEQ